MIELKIFFSLKIQLKIKPRKKIVKIASNNDGEKLFKFIDNVSFSFFFFHTSIYNIEVKVESKICLLGNSNEKA